MQRTERFRPKNSSICRFLYLPLASCSFNAAISYSQESRVSTSSSPDSEVRWTNIAESLLGEVEIGIVVVDLRRRHQLQHEETSEAAHNLLQVVAVRIPSLFQLLVLR